MSSETAPFTVAFDADDTLWHNEDAFRNVEHLFDELMAPWADAQTAQGALIQIERDNVGLYGYGVKSFALSMIAAACHLSNDEVPAATLRRFVETANDLLAMPTKLIDDARETLEAVAARFPTMIITKGDLHHQMRRLAAADISDTVFDVEVVAEKDAATYARILGRHRIDPTRFVMIGNSIVSDVAPLLELGAMALHIPYYTTWALETATADPDPSPRWKQLDTIAQVPAALEELAGLL